MACSNGPGRTDIAAARQFAIDHGIFAAGWALNEPPHPGPIPDGCDDVDLYKKHAKLIYPNDRSVEGPSITLRRCSPVTSVGCTPPHSGEDWCCRIVDQGFRYREGGDFDMFDMHIVRRCIWARAGTAESVPGVVRRAFAGLFGTISRMITDAAAAIEAAEIILDQRQAALDGDLFALASPEDLEDIIALYLQDNGWHLLPSTAKASMASYEFVLVHRDTGQRAGVQVKSGNVGFLDQTVALDFDVFFVFLANPAALLTGDVDRVRRISREDLITFAKRNWVLLPQRLKTRWPISSMR